MSTEQNTFLTSVTGWVASIVAALSLPFEREPDIEQLDCEKEPTVDPDFEGWLHSDPMVTGNPASRYGDDAPGYLTGNGLGSLEIGAADD